MASFQAFKLGGAGKQRPRPSPALFAEEPEGEEDAQLQQGAQGPAADELSAAQHKVRRRRHPPPAARSLLAPLHVADDHMTHGASRPARTPFTTAPHVCAAGRG